MAKNSGTSFQNNPRLRILFPEFSLTPPMSKPGSPIPEGIPYLVEIINPVPNTPRLKVP